jgi:hypothetical protein
MHSRVGKERRIAEIDLAFPSILCYVLISIERASTMLKDDNLPKEPARRKAEREWRNNAVEKAIKEEKATTVPTAPKEPKEPKLVMLLRMIR